MNRSIAIAVVDLSGRLHGHPATSLAGPLHRTPSDRGDYIRVACKERHCAPVGGHR